MNQGTNNTVLVAGALALLVILLPVMLLALGIQEEEVAEDREESLSDMCVPGADGKIDVPEKYREPIKKAAEEAQIPYALLAAQLHTESNFDPSVVSHAGARGIAQFMPDAWGTYGEGGDPHDPEDAIAAQGRFLADLNAQAAEMADSDQERLELVFAGYNAGMGAVKRAGGIPPIQETQDYVKKIMRLGQVNTEDCKKPGSEIGDLGSGEWTNPLPGSVLTSGLGYRGCLEGVECNEITAYHNAIDLATPGPGAGTVVAPTDLEITSISTSESDAWRVTGRMTDDPKLVMSFIHCEANSHRVSVGDTIAAGTPICTEGATGIYTQGVHLHFQVHPADVADDRYVHKPVLDPKEILTEKGVLK